MEKLLPTDSIIQKLFDPRVKRYKVFVDENHKQIYQMIPLEAKIKYLENYLQEHWQEICGEHLGKNCAVEKLHDNCLTICTSSSLFANELFIMKNLLLQKINRALDGCISIKELKFHAGNITKKQATYAPELEEEKALKIVRCPKCGAKMLSDNELCNVCEREERHNLQKKLIELIKVQPWLQYKECQQYLPCSHIAFNDAKEILQNYYFEKVRLDSADEMDCYMAVMLLTGKSAEVLDTTTYENSLVYLRRNQDVSASRV